MMQGDAIVTVVAYLCDDAGILAGFVDAAVGMLARSFANFELILMDDHSTDATPRIVDDLLNRHPGVRYLRLARRSGEEVGATAGLEAAVGDCVVVMRARFDPLEEVPEMVRLAAEHGGSVLGTTTEAPRRGLLFRLLRGLFYKLMNVLLRAHMPPDSTGFCALTRAAVNTISRTRSKRRHLRMLACTIGYPVTRHRYTPRQGAAQHDTRSLREAVKEATSLLVANSKTPLRLVSSLGILAGSCNLLYVLYVIGIYLFKKEVAPGWATLSLQIAAMFFFVFLILTSLAEYVAQILEESQDNPLYHVEVDRTSVRTAGTGMRNVLAESTVGRPECRRDDEAA
jgi:glycosyltransferase involved in cell wall biosynthesis